MTTLASLRSIADAAYIDFRKIITTALPGMDEWHWYRALVAIKGGVGRHNDDKSHDSALAAHEGIKAAHDEYIRALHAFYALRDGPNGFLGGRGL
jgi:hypothetical protein